MSALPVHRPASGFDPLALLQIVRQVAESSAVEFPGQLSTRSWDTARNLSGRFADTPAARRICEHLRLSWTKVRELSFMGGHAQRVALGHALGGDEGDWLTDEYAAFTLKLIARRLEVATLTPSQYQAERDVMAGGHRRPVGNAAQLPLPTPDQIEIVVGSWDNALARAGLLPRRGLGGHRARVAPTPIVEVLDRCHEHHNAEPTFRELVLFARANGIPFPRKERGRPYSTYLKEWKEARVARGLPVPAGPPPKAERPDYARDVGAAMPEERRSKHAWDDHAEVVGWVMRYLDELEPRERSSQRGYDAWARRREGAPWASVVQRHGGWVAVRAEAWKMLAGQQHSSLPG